ncbi:KinB-signaling pathway activation protein [Gorillibacterium sp. sgz5001074]|uniref:KinB-signaling pathway activation protein n=1 Tax=Gorillibacterium sp. sgz5001074 TaxID=3446695 RepID=UPI003F676012
MTIRNWLRLFWTTLLAGSAAALAAGGVLVALFPDFTLMELSEPGFNWQTGSLIVFAGAAVSVVSHIGFFSYLIVRDIFLGILRSHKLWNIFQLIVTAVCFEIMVYMRWTYNGGAEEGGWFPYTLLPSVMALVAFAIAYWKIKWTNRAALVPTLFFMFVGTFIEVTPALRYNTLSIVFMLVPLWASNAWQILMLPRFLRRTKEQA